jgi:hypothetical protein
MRSSEHNSDTKSIKEALKKVYLNELQLFDTIENLAVFFDQSGQIFYM